MDDEFTVIRSLPDSTKEQETRLKSKLGMLTNKNTCAKLKSMKPADLGSQNDQLSIKITFFLSG
jgi:hypothetical protein